MAHNALGECAEPAIAGAAGRPVGSALLKPMTNAGGAPNIVLTGFMGTGKTAVGRALAARLDRPFVDTDERIVDDHGPIPEIFASHGEARFRALERALAVELSQRGGLVVATGGGMLLDPEVGRVMGATARVFCLTAAPTTIIERVRAGGVSARPLLAGDDAAARVATLLAERAAAYAAFEPVPTDGLSVETVVDEILRRLASGEI